LSGEVLAVNESLEDEPELVNSDPYNDGWFFQLQPEDLSELEGLMSADEYQSMCDEDDA
jgi:glycine cleavage system H protein